MTPLAHPLAPCLPPPPLCRLPGKDASAEFDPIHSTDAHKMTVGYLIGRLERAEQPQVSELGGGGVVRLAAGALALTNRSTQAQLRCGARQ